MWMFLGMIAAMFAGGMSDAFVSNRADASGADDSPEDGDDDTRDAPGTTAHGDLLAAAFAPEPAGFIDAPLPTPDLDTDLDTDISPADSDETDLPWDHHPDDQHPLANGMPPHEGDDASWIDWSGDEGVHSSDAFPPDDTPPQGVALEAGDGGALLNGSDGDDTLIGGVGADTLNGGLGDDHLSAGAGGASLNGGMGDDTLIGGAGDDTLVGGWGDDLLVAGGGNNVLMGGAGDDTLVGAVDPAQAGGQNFLNGGEGDDLLILGGGDVGHGGSGADTFNLGDWIAPGTLATIMDYTPGEDQIVLSYNPDIHPDPALSVTEHPDNPADALIVLDDEVIAHVLGGAGLAAQDIVLSPGHPAAIA